MLAGGRDVELFHLLLSDPRRRVDHHVTPSGVLREGNEVTDVCAASAEQRAEAVKSERKAAVRGSTKFESPEQKAELPTADVDTKKLRRLAWSDGIAGQ